MRRKREVSIVKKRETTTDKCIVFDMDELHLHSLDKGESDGSVKYNNAFTGLDTIGIRDKLYHIKITDLNYGDEVIMWGVIRPDLYKFLDFCFEHFKVVAIWSAGEHDYVHSCITQVWRCRNSPHVVYTARDCEYQCLDCEKFDYNNKKEDCECGGELRMVKPLRKFWEHPTWGKYMNETNTIIIDDRNSVFRCCNPGNGIQIPKFEPEMTPEGLCKPDDSFDRLIEFFSSDKFVECKDVRTLKKDVFKEEELRSDD